VLGVVVVVGLGCSVTTHKGRKRDREKERMVKKRMRDEKRRNERT